MANKNYCKKKSTPVNATGVFILELVISLILQGKRICIEL